MVATKIQRRMETSRITTKDDNDGRRMFLREQQQEISCDLASNTQHEMLPILLGTSMKNKRERDEIG